MQEIQHTINQRGNTHGSFENNARVAQNLKQILRTECGYVHLTKIQKEALDMICHKMARIISGNPNFADHWHDISGYATLVETAISTANEGRE